jgi:hypothetical protein
MLKLCDNLSRYKFIAAFVLQSVCIRTAVSICDQRRSCPDVACEVCSVGRCYVRHVKLELIETSDLNTDNTKPA